MAALQGHFEEAVAWQRANLQWAAGRAAGRAAERATGDDEQASLQMVGLARVLNLAATDAARAAALQAQASVEYQRMFGLPMPQPLDDLALMRAAGGALRHA